MKPDLVKELYEEIDRIRPAVEYCLAPRKAHKKEGASSLRSAAVVEAVSSTKDEEELRKHAKTLYDWVDGPTSRVRMLLHWQGSGSSIHDPGPWMRNPSWLLVSEPGFLKVLGDLGRKFKFVLKLRPGSNVV